MELELEGGDDAPVHPTEEVADLVVFPAGDRAANLTRAITGGLVTTI